MGTSWIYIAIPAIVIFIAFAALLISQYIKRRIGLPAGQIVYADAEGWGKARKPLYDSALGLTGKPDYVIRKNGMLIPVEAKSTWAPLTPYDSHVLQLAAYCLLIEKQFGQRPTYGLLRYRNRTYKIQFTNELETRVVDLVHEIRDQKNCGMVNRSHNQPKRCARCGFRDICEQRL